MNHTFKTNLIIFLGGLLMTLSTIANAYQCPALTPEFYQTRYAAAQWVAKVEVIAPALQKKGIMIGKQALIATVAVKYLHRYDAALPLALFDAPITLELAGKQIDIPVGSEWLVFAEGSVSKGWSAYSLCGERTVSAAWENNAAPANVFVSRLAHSNRQHGVYENQGQSYQLHLLAPQADTLGPNVPLTGVHWFAVPDNAAPASDTQNAAVSIVDIRTDSSSKHVGLGKMVLNATSQGVPNQTARLVFEHHTPLPAGFYRLVTAQPQLLAPYTAQGSSWRFQVKRASAVQHSVALKRLEGTQLHDQTCGTPHSSRAAFELGKTLSGDNSAMYANLLVHARMVSAAGEPNTPSELTQRGKITVLNWLYAGAKPNRDEMAREGVAMSPPPLGFFTPSAGAQLIGKTIMLGASFAALRIPQGAEFIAVAVPNHTPSDVWATRSLRPSENAKPIAQGIKGEGANATAPALDHQRPNEKVREEITAQYLSGKATLYNHACYAWVLVKDGMLQWRDAPPEPIAAYMKKRQARMGTQWQHRLSSGIGNFHTVYTSWSQQALELDLAGWEGETSVPFSAESNN